MIAQLVSDFLLLEKLLFELKFEHQKKSKRARNETAPGNDQELFNELCFNSRKPFKYEKHMTQAIRKSLIQAIPSESPNQIDAIRLVDR